MATAERNSFRLPPDIEALIRARALEFPQPDQAEALLCFRVMAQKALDRGYTRQPAATSERHHLLNDETEF